MKRCHCGHISSSRETEFGQFRSQSSILILFTYQLRPLRRFQDAIFNKRAIALQIWENVLGALGNVRHPGRLFWLYSALSISLSDPARQIYFFILVLYVFLSIPTSSLLNVFIVKYT